MRVGPSMVIVILFCSITLTFPTSGTYDDHHGATGYTPLSENARVPAMAGYFTENIGQVTDADVLFVNSGHGQRISLLSDGMMVRAGDGDLEIVRFLFTGSNRVRPRGIDPLPWKSNYFFGNDPSEWRTGARNYGTVIYEDLWDGIDLRLNMRPEGLKYDYIVDPHIDPSIIRVQVGGHEDLTLTEEGDIAIRTGTGPEGDFSVTDSGLEVFYQDKTTERLSARFSVHGDTYSFDVEGRDPSRTLVIDPLVHSTFVGGAGRDECYGLTVDDDGRSFFTGTVDSLDFPTTTGSIGDSSNGGWDIIVAGLSADGRSLLFSTYLGGYGDDGSFDICLDGEGDIYLSGATSSINFPTTPGAFDREHDGVHSDAYVMKLARDGGSILYSTLLGGSDDDACQALDVDISGSAYVIGYTRSTDFPTTAGALKSSIGANDRDAFIVMLTPDGSSQSYSTLLGGSGFDEGYGIALGGSGRVTFFGETFSQGLQVTAGAFDTVYNGNRDCFLGSMDMTNGELVFLTYIGDREQEGCGDLATDDDGNVYVVGTTGSGSFPTSAGSYDNSYNGGDRDCFVMSFEPDGELRYSTFLGSASSDQGSGISVGDRGNAYVCGVTTSYFFPTTAISYDKSYNEGLCDAFVTELSSDGSFLVHSAYLGGSDEDYGIRIAVGPSGDAFVLSFTRSQDFPVTTGSFDSGFNGGYFDMALTRIDLRVPPFSPQGLTAKGSDRKMDLSWDPPLEDGGSDVIGYNLYRIDRNEGWPSFLCEVQSTDYTDTDLENGLYYRYQVTALNEKGEGPRSPEIKVMPESVPYAPTGLNAVAGDRIVYLNWSPPADDGGHAILKYRIERGYSPDSLSLLEEVTKLSLQDNTVRNGIEYFYSISAMNDLGYGPPSVVGTYPASSPGPPSSPVAVPGDGQVTLSWTAPADDGGYPVEGYMVFRSVSGGDPELLQTLGPATAYIDTGLTNGVPLSYTIGAVNQLGLGTMAGPLKVTPMALPDAPVQVTAIAGVRWVKLSWQPPDDGGSKIQGYNVYRTIGGGAEELIEGGLTALSYEDIDLEIGVTYGYSVSAVNSLGEGARSEPVAAIPATTPGSPTDLGGKADRTSVTIQWSAPDDGGSPITGYRIFRGTRSIEPVFYTTIGAVNNFTDDRVDQGVTYRYYIVAVNRIGEGTRSDVLSVPIPSGPDSKIGLRGSVVKYWYAVLIVLVISLLLIVGLFYLIIRRTGMTTDDVSVYSKERSGELSPRTDSEVAGGKR